MTNEIQQNRYDQTLRRVAGIIGPGSKVSEVLTELFPTVDLESLPYELLLLGGVRPAHGGGFQPAAAGNNATMQVVNPANSGSIVTITEVSFGLSAIGGVNIIFTSSLLGDAGTANFADSRAGIAATPAPVAFVSAANVGAPSGFGSHYRVLANTSMRIWNPRGLYVVSPGRALQVQANTQNVVLYANFHWREREALPSELSVS